MNPSPASDFTGPSDAAPGTVAPHPLRAHVTEGRRAASQQRWADARDHFAAGRRAAPHDPNVGFNLAMALLQLGEGTRSLRLLEDLRLTSSGLQAKVLIRYHLSRCDASLGAESWSLGPEAAPEPPRVTLLGLHHAAPLRARGDGPGWLEAGLPPLADVHDAQRFITDAIANPNASHVALLDARHGLIGLGGLQGCAQDPTPYYWIAPGFRGRGHGHGLLRCLLRVARRRRLHHVVARVHGHNLASIRMLVGAGFRRVPSDAPDLLYRRELMS